LDHLIRSSQPIRLKFLEIQSSIGDEDMVGTAIQPFLESFKGLEALFLSTSARSETLEIWRSASHHRATLTRFVHHQRTIDLDEESPLFELECDLPDLSFYEVADLGEDPSQNPLGELDLKFVGLCCDSPFLVSGGLRTCDKDLQRHSPS
jgi:hypothetical protein